MSRLALGLLAATIVVGCGPQSRSHPVIHSPEPVEAASTRPGPPPRSVDGLTLEQAVALARVHHPDLAAFSARIEEAEGRAEQAGLMPNPDMAFRMESAPFRGKTTGDADYIVGPTLHIPTGGRLAAARRVEELEGTRIAAAARARRFEIESAVHLAFAGASLAASEVSIREEAVAAAGRSVELARSRLDAGDALPQEVERARVESIRAEAERVGAQASLRQALVELAARLGLPDLSIAGLAAGDVGQPSLPALEALLASLETHPSVVELALQVEVAGSRLELALAERYPDVSVDFLYRHIGGDEVEAFDVGVSLPLPVTDRNQGAIRAARAAIRASRAEQAAQVARLRTELIQNRVRLESAVGRLRAIEGDLLPRARSILEAEEARYRAGDLTLAEILPLRRDLIDIRLEELQARREAFEAMARLSPFLRAR